jgi:uncharacterized membrane protein YeaQ/YmgE (transglycosylase-associated protein family)
MDGEHLMSTEHLILSLAIGVVAGFLAGKIMKGSGFGLIGDLVVGVIGSFIGGWVFGLLGISGGSILFVLVAATVGALILLYLLRLAKSA